MEVRTVHPSNRCLEFVPGVNKPRWQKIEGCACPEMPQLFGRRYRQDLLNLLTFDLDVVPPLISNLVLTLSKHLCGQFSALSLGTIGLQNHDSYEM